MESVHFFINNSLICFESDIETCKLLLTDDEFTLDYIHRAIQSGSIDHVSVEDLETLDVRRVENQPGATAALQAIGGAEHRQEIWLSKGKQTALDLEATDMFLQIRASKKFITLFQDKKTHKHKLWAEIAEIMQSKGFYLGEVKESGEKVRQKFANLQRQYLNYIRHMTTTGETPVPEPQHYGYLQILFGKKDKFFPKKIVDSIREEPVAAATASPRPTSPTAGPSAESIGSQSFQELSSEMPDVQSSRPEGIPGGNRFEGTKKTAKPQSTKDQFIHAIKECTESNTKMLNDKFDSLFQLIEEQNRALTQQNEQRERLIQLLAKLVAPRGKRKRRSSSSDSE